MRKLGWTLGVTAALAFAPAQVMAGGSFSWSWTNVCGGNNFITCSSGSFSYDQGTKTITVTIINEAVETDVYRGIGLFNLSEAPTSWTGTPSPADGWAEGPLPNAGIPTTGRFTVVGSGEPESLPEGPTFTFTFTFANDISASIADVGVMYHAIGFGECSTTVGVVNDGAGGGQDFGNSEELDPTCTTTTTTPEPGTMVLLGTGLAGLLGIARRRQNGLNTEDAEV